jgi:3-isopropylmalate/(R)-2-methylmalate dehydratase small subunit
MEPFHNFVAIAAPLEVAKIDTGMILPGRFMRRHRKPGSDYADAFLHDLRFDEHGEARPDFPLNLPAYKPAQILVTDADFGCGSSREGAAYAVLDFGLRALIGPSFGDIFAANLLQNGVLPVVLPYPEIHELWRQLRADPGSSITIDLPRQVVVAPLGNEYGFDINPLRKDRLIRGIDDIDVTLQHVDAVNAYEEERHRRLPWLPRATREQPDAG